MIKQGLPKSNLTSAALVLRLFRYFYTGEGFFLCIKHSVLIDPCCGSGGMFVQSLKFVDRHNGSRQKVSIIGQESVPDT